MVTEPADAASVVAAILDEVAVPYVIGGSVASSFHGEPRATNDLDVLVDLRPDRVPALVRALRPTFEVWEDTVLDAVRRGRSFSAIHVEELWKVDFFVAGRERLDRLQLERGVAVRLAGRSVRMCSAEDIVLRKLEWNRRSGGVLERQLRDVVGVLKARRDALDLGYLHETARALGLADLLERCLRDAGLAT
jgi:hypothetical protein